MSTSLLIKEKGKVGEALMNRTTAEILEFEDKTVDKAIEAACRYFECDKEQLEVEIITRGSTGLFGLGGKKAKIKAKPKDGVGAEIVEDKEDLETGPEESEPIDLKEVETDRVPVSQPESCTSHTKELDRERLEEFVALACQITNEILEKSGLSGKAHVVEQTSKPFVNITGDDLSLIIGKEGQTLDALEYLVNLSLRRQNSQINYRVMLEAAGYRERRKKNLVALAERLAAKVKRTGRPVSLQPMPARERRIVHVALKEFKGIRTHSSGQGTNRKVVITPTRKKRPSSRRRG